MAPARAAIASVVLVLAAAGCVDVPRATPPGSGRSPGASSPPVSSRLSPDPTETAFATPSAWADIPAGFPVPAGAVRVVAPRDDDLLARWSSQISGADAYAYYTSSLPAAGYPIEELVPGGTAAVIRFRGPGDEAWVLILSGVDPLTIELWRDPSSAIGGDGDP